MIALLGIIAGGCFLTVIYRPAFGAYLLLFTTPLIAGITRGTIPLRPNEMVLLLVVAAVAIRVILLMLSRRYHPPVYDRMDIALLLLGATSSVVPVLWRIARDLPLTQDDLLYSAVLIKYYVLFRVFRFSVVTADQVRTCLWISLTAAAIEATIGILQVLNLFGIPDLLLRFFDRPLDSGTVTYRASSTLSSAFSHADLMMMNLIIALALLRVARRRRWLLLSAAALFLASCVASGEFSGYIGLLTVLFTFGVLNAGSLRRVLPALIAAGALIAIPFWRVVSLRLEDFDTGSGLPPSWNGRLENLQRFFLPKLAEGANWLLGVQPAPRLPATETWREFIYIECGYVWLLWIGGVPFLLSFVYFVATALILLGRIAKTRVDPVGAAATSGFCYVVTLTVLMLFDPHLTMRGTADMLFPLLAMSLTPQPAVARARQLLSRMTQAQPGRAVVLAGGSRAVIG